MRPGLVDIDKAKVLPTFSASPLTSKVSQDSNLIERVQEGEDEPAASEDKIRDYLQELNTYKSMRLGRPHPTC